MNLFLYFLNIFDQKGTEVHCSQFASVWLTQYIKIQTIIKMYLEAILAQLDSKKQAYCLGWK
jgi:hypothetical protein